MNSYLKLFFQPTVNVLEWVLYLLVCFTFIALSVSKIWLYVSVFPFIAIIPLYCGHIYRHPFHNNAIIMMVGIMNDVCFSKPIGLTTSVLLTLDFVLTLLDTKLRSLKFIGQWLVFLVYIVLYALLTSLLQILILQESIIPHNLVQTIIITWIVFPILASTFYFLTNKLKKAHIA